MISDHGTVAVNAADLRLVLNQRTQHGHTHPGVWDDDNRPGIAGTPCLECAARARLTAALASTAATSAQRRTPTDTEGLDQLLDDYQLAAASWGVTQLLADEQRMQAARARVVAESSAATMRRLVRSAGSCPRCGSSGALGHYAVCNPCAAALGWDPPCVACHDEQAERPPAVAHIATCAQGRAAQAAVAGVQPETEPAQ